MNNWIKTQDNFLEETMTILQMIFFSECNCVVISLDKLVLSIVIIYFHIKIILALLIKFHLFTIYFVCYITFLLINT